MLKLKLQYFGHLIQRTDSFEKTLMLGKIEGGRRRGRQKMRWLDVITDSMDMSLGTNSCSWWWTGRPDVLQSMGSQRVGHDWVTELNWTMLWWSLPYLNMNQLSVTSVAQSCPTLCDPENCSMPCFPVLHQLSELAQTHVLWVSYAIQPSCPLSFPSPPAFDLSQHQGLFQWFSSSHQVAKVLKYSVHLMWSYLVD